MNKATRDRMLSKLRERAEQMEHLSEENVDKVLTFLNELVALDRAAVERLVETRVQCNDAIADHPSVQVGKDADGNPVVGLLGIVNGLMGTQPEGANKPGWGYIAASFDDGGKLAGFVRIDKK
jgi:hypothetical protein